jgi:hypothetical protein
MNSGRHLNMWKWWEINRWDSKWASSRAFTEDKRITQCNVEDEYRDIWNISRDLDQTLLTNQKADFFVKNQVCYWNLNWRIRQKIKFSHPIVHIKSVLNIIYLFWTHSLRRKDQRKCYESHKAQRENTVQKMFKDLKVSV